MIPPQNHVKEEACVRQEHEYWNDHYQMILPSTAHLAPSREVDGQLVWCSTLCAHCGTCLVGSIEADC